MRAEKVQEGVRMRKHGCVDVSVHSCMYMHAKVRMYLWLWNLGQSCDFLPQRLRVGSSQPVLLAAPREQRMKVAFLLTHPEQEEPITPRDCQGLAAYVFVTMQT